MNIQLFNLINQFAGKNPLLDNFMIFIAKYLIFIVPFFLLYLYFKKSKKQNRKKSIFVFVSILISSIIGWSIGFFYYHPRPFAINLGTELISHIPDSSFPSDHTIVFFATAFALFYIKEKKNAWLFLILGFLVGLARIFAGVHFPADILGSFIIAWVVVFVMSKFKKKIFGL